MNWDYARHAVAVLLLLSLGGVLLWSVGFGIYLNRIRSHGWASTRRLLLTLPPVAGTALVLSGLFWENGFVPHWLLAHAGRPSDQMALAGDYFTGDRLLARNLVQARAWIIRAAESGLGEAQVELADLELDGRNAANRPDPAAALAWARRAANQGLLDGRLLTGGMLLSHPDLAQPGERAQAYFDAAIPGLRSQVAAGSAQAMFSLGILKLRGQGLPLDPETGFTLLLQAQVRGISLQQAVQLAMVQSKLPPEVIRRARAQSQTNPGRP